MDTPYIRIEDTGELISLRGEVTTVGRGHGADVRLDDPSVSRLHAEIVWRGPYIYVADLGLRRSTAPELTRRDRRTRLANEVIALGLVRPLAEYGSGQVQHAPGVGQQPPLDGMEHPAH